MQGTGRRPVVRIVCLALLSLAPSPAPLRASLFPDLSPRPEVGDPTARNPLDREREGPKGLAAGDLNGDGRADIVVASLDGSISALLGSDEGVGDQILVPASGLLAGASLRAVACADFDRDGKTDVAAADIARGRVVCLRGGGDGTLEPYRAIVVGPARALATSDCNGDGLADLLVGCTIPDCDQDRCTTCCERHVAIVLLLLGAGDGTFAEPRTLLHEGCWCLYDIGCADMNGDGALDVLVLDYTGGRLLMLRGFGDGTFARAGEIVAAGRGARAFCVAHVDETLVDGAPPPGALLDVVIANRDTATLTLFRNVGDFRFAAPSAITGIDSPRSVAAGDLDGDGAVELVATNRFANTISIFRGLGGGRFPAIPLELPAGTSPREVILADVTGDGALDAATANRVSGDLSIFIGQPGLAAFLVARNFLLSGLSPVDVDAADFNEDGLPDAAVAALRSHDVRVRINAGGAGFGEETAIGVGFGPVDVAATDIDGDGHADIAVACLGGAEKAGSSRSGSLAVLLGNGDGTFRPPVVTEIGVGFSPKWLRLGDLSGDGVLDAVLGCMAGQVVALRGRGDGSFDPGVALTRGGGDGRPVSVTLGDFTGDGLIDIATSRCEVLINDGAFFSGSWSGRTTSFAVTHPRARVETWFVDSADLDRDGALDIMLALSFVMPDPIGVFYGRGDGTFEEPSIYEGPDMGVVALGADDFDGDGITDIAVGNRCAANVIIMRGRGDRTFERLEEPATYSVEALAVADLNADGRPDLLGVGLGLWFLLNGGSSPLVTPAETGGFGFVPKEQVYLNELLAYRQETTAGQAGVAADWIELYNHGRTLVDLSGWKLREYARDGTTNIWPFPAGAVIRPMDYVVVFCTTSGAAIDPTVPGLLCTGFELSRDGEGVALLDPLGAAVDRIDYPALPADVSYARYFDGAPYFNQNPVPTIGRANMRAANIEPSVKLANPAWIGGSIAVTARAHDDVAIAFASVSYRVAGQGAFTEVLLNDDGRHGDGAPADGVFGMSLGGVPPGSTIEYFLRVVDTEGQVDMEPADPGSELVRIAIPAGRPALRLSEVVPSNRTGLADERGEHEDWVEVCNCGFEPVDLTGVSLARDLFDLEEAFRFPEGTTLAAGQHLVVYCDGEPADGRFHAPFRLSQEGDSLVLARTGSAPTMLDSIAFGAMPIDRAFGIASCDGDLGVLDRPTPNEANAAAGMRFVRGDANASGSVEIGDAVRILAYLFAHSEALACESAADANDTGKVDIADPIYILGYLFARRPAPRPPFPGCGFDETGGDPLACASFAPCRASP